MPQILRMRRVIPGKRIKPPRRETTTGSVLGWNRTKPKTTDYRAKGDRRPRNDIRVKDFEKDSSNINQRLRRNRGRSTRDIEFD
ncbi:MAG TPA: hypothetical protein PK655_00915 [archaeon]|nr:hypothetical protein [archaeon]HPV65997.1 hypothetical protein [archaeon]HRS42371.1 hypothetical protein [Candidatus Diapherotrites archaeon]